MGPIRWCLMRKCLSCGGRYWRGSKFCPQCGTSSPASAIVCPKCQAQVKAHSTFCRHCGEDLTKIATWRKETADLDAAERDTEFARRIELAKMGDSLATGLVVEPGTQALVFQGGRLAATLSEGSYDVRRPPEKIDMATPATAILIDAGDVSVMVPYDGLRTKEDLAFNATFKMLVRLSDAQALFVNLMHRRSTLSREDLTGLVRDETTNALQQSVRAVSAKDLPDSRERIEKDLRDAAGPLLARAGLELVHLQTVALEAGPYDAVRDARGETFVQEELQAEGERRAALNRRIRETLTREQMSRIASRKELQDFLRQQEHELGLRGVIRKAEMEELERTYDDQHKDAETTRRHLLEKLELEHELVMERTRRAGQGEAMDGEIDLRRKALAARQQEEWAQALHKQKLGDVGRQEHEADRASRLRMIREKTKLGEEARRQKIDLDHEEQTRRLQEKRQGEEITQDMADRQARREMDHLRVLSEVDQARLAADLRRTEALKGFSEDQIVALMAEKSPHVAAALAERYKAQAHAQVAMNAETKALYERLLTSKESEADRQERFAERALESVERAGSSAVDRERRHAEDVQRMAAQSADRVADVASAKAGAPGAPGLPRGCPKCRAAVPAGARFCENCGQSISV
jgi:hypothetical protein